MSAPFAWIRAEPLGIHVMPADARSFPRLPFKPMGPRPMARLIQDKERKQGQS